MAAAVGRERGTAAQRLPDRTAGVQHKAYSLPLVHAENSSCCLRTKTLPLHLITNKVDKSALLLALDFAVSILCKPRERSGPCAPCASGSTHGSPLSTVTDAALEIPC